MSPWTIANKALLPITFRTSQLGGKTYLYEYKYQPTFKDPIADWVVGDHTDDLDFVFGKPLMGDDELFSEEEEQFNIDVMSYYSNFAYTGLVYNITYIVWRLITVSTYLCNVCIVMLSIIIKCKCKCK